MGVAYGNFNILRAIKKNLYIFKKIDVINVAFIQRGLKRAII